MVKRRRSKSGFEKNSIRKRAEIREKNMCNMKEEKEKVDEKKKT